MLLFVDTETSGLINFSLPVDDPSQPHIVQLAALLCDDDEDCSVRETYQSIIRPDGWEIQTAAQAVHGISADYACRFGEALSSVLGKFYGLVAVADALGSGRLIAHNTPFDLRMILRDTSTLNESFDGRYVSNLRPFCTMRAMTPRCRLPSRRRGEFKWPKLEEAYEFTFGRKPPAEAAHTALGDVTACRELFAEGRRREWWR